MNDNTQRSISSSKFQAQSLLAEFASSENFLADIQTAFGNDINLASLEQFSQQWQDKNFNSFPKIEIRSSAEINGANGAFSVDTNKIYLSQEFIANNDSDALTNLILEEYGHFVDSQINVSDAPGDEGYIFSWLVQENNLSDDDLQQLKHENDRVFVFLDQERIGIEQDIQIEQITNNDFGLQSPSISGDNIVWEQEDGIVLYDGENIQQISASDEDESPSISGNKVVWSRFVLNNDNFTGDFEIFLYDGDTNSITQITDNDLNDRSPSISGNNIVWEQSNEIFLDNKIVLYDGESIQQISTSNKDKNPSISGKKVVWNRSNENNDNSEIFLYDGDTNSITQITDNDLNDRNPSISGDNIVWEQGGVVFLYDGNNVRQISNFSDKNVSPSISGNQIVWERGGDIFLATLASDNQPPVAVNDLENFVNAGESITIDVLANDSDPDENSLTIESVSEPTSGTASISNGQIVYTPDDGFEGTDSFTYTINDGNGSTDTAEVTVSVINLFPLKVEGNFLDTDNDGVFEANGEILIGRADGIFPLIRLQGEAEFDDKIFKAEGQVFWEDESLGIENNEIINRPLLEGNFNIDVGQSFTKEGQFIETQVLSEDAKIGGLDIAFSSLNLLKFGIALDGNFKLPEKLLEIDIPDFEKIDILDSIDPLSGLEIQAKNNDALFIGQTINGQNGIGFGSESGKIKIPFGNTNIFDLVGIKSGEADLDYIPEEDKLEIKGKFTLRAPLLELDVGLIEAEIPEFTLDLEGEGLDEKSIQIKNGIVDIDAVIKTSKDAELELPLGFEFSDFEVALKSNDGKLTDIVGKTNIEFPWSKIKNLPDSAVTEIGFKTNKSTAIDDKDAPFVVDDVVVEIEGFNIPIKPPVLFLNDIKGGIKNITPTKDENDENIENIEYVGGIGLSVGPEIEFKLPTFFGFDVFDFIGIDIPDDEIALAKIKLEAEPGFQEVKQTNTENSEELVALGGKVALSLIHEELFKSEGQLKWDWAKKTFESTASVSTTSPTILLNGVLKGSSKLTINYADETKLVSTIKGEFQVPDLGIFLGARGRTYVDSNASIVFSDNDEPRDDFIAVWTTLTLPIPNPIPDEDSYTIGFNISFDGDFDLISSSKEIPLIGSWDIEAETPWFLVTATWENSTSDDVEVRVETPDGSFIEESDFAANGIYIVEELSGDYAKTVVVDNPTPGIWDYEVVNDTGLGEVTYTASRDTIAPTTEIISTVVDETNSEITINYNAFDGDSEAQISLFYDTDNQDFDGVPIVRGLAENDGAGSFVWTPESVAPGEYFVYAMSQDENNAPVFSYSTEKVQVSGEADLSVSKVANVESVDVSEELTYTVTVINNGAIDSKGIKLLEYLPKGATFISANVALVEQADDLLTFDLGDLANGASKSVDITIKAPTIVGSTDFGSLVTSKTFDSIPSNDAEILTIEATNSQSLAELFVNNVSQAEGSDGNTNFTFTVSLSDVSTEEITVDYATQNGSAIAGEDYVAASGTLEFAPGETEKTITVEVLSDDVFEAEEFFTVNLSNADGVTLIDEEVIGTIINNEVDVLAATGNEPFTASLSDTDDTYIYQDETYYYDFFALPVDTSIDSGDIVTVTLASENFDPILMILDSEGNVLEYNDNANEGSTNSELTFIVGAEDSFFVSVETKEANQTGDYLLDVDTINVDVSNPENTPLTVIDSIQTVENLTGSLSDTDIASSVEITGEDGSTETFNIFEDNYLLQGSQVGQEILVSLSSDVFDGELNIFAIDSSGNANSILESTNLVPGIGTTETTNFTIESGSNYLISVTGGTADTDAVKFGDYSLATEVI